MVPGLITPGQTGQARYTEAAFPVGGFLALERRRAAVRPSEHLSSIVGGVDDDGVVRHAEVVEQLQELTHHSVGLDHSVGI
jgi:hypothetical protein